MKQNSLSEKAARSGEKKGSEARAISALYLFGGPVNIFGKPVDRNVLFSNHRGIYKKKVEKRQRRLLIKIPFINAFLEDGELIKLMTSGYSPLSRLERFLLRYLTVFRRRALFVFTDRRVLYIPTTFTYGYRYSVAEIRYTNCESIQVIGRSLVFIFNNGGFEKFPYIARKERRKMRAVIDSLVLGGPPGGSQNLTYLCARCAAAIPDDSAACPQCRLRFRTAEKAGKLALLIPGGGYFYMGNTLYGFASAILEVLFAGMLILSIVDMYHGSKGGIPAVILLGMTWIGIKAITFFHAHDLLHDCFPIMKQPPPLKS